MIVRHNLIANVEAGSYTVSPPLDIHQNDNNSHLLIIRLVNDQGNSIEIGGNTQAQIIFSYPDTEEQILSDSVEIINPYRGLLSYKIGGAILKRVARVTAYLKLYNPKDSDIEDLLDDEEECKACNLASVSFVIKVFKNATYVGDESKTDATITVEEYRKIMEHIAPDEVLHTTQEEHNYLTDLLPYKDKLLNLINGELEINLYYDPETYNYRIDKTMQEITQAITDKKIVYLIDDDEGIKHKMPLNNVQESKLIFIRDQIDIMDESVSAMAKRVFAIDMNTSVVTSATIPYYG